MSNRNGTFLGFYAKIKKTDELQDIIDNDEIGDLYQAECDDDEYFYLYNKKSCHNRNDQWDKQLSKELEDITPEFMERGLRYLEVWCNDTLPKGLEISYKFGQIDDSEY